MRLIGGLWEGWILPMRSMHKTAYSWNRMERADWNHMHLWLVSHHCHSVQPSLSWASTLALCLMTHLHTGYCFEERVNCVGQNWLGPRTASEQGMGSHYWCLWRWYIISGPVSDCNRTAILPRLTLSTWNKPQLIFNVTPHKGKGCSIRKTSVVRDNFSSDSEWYLNGAGKKLWELKQALGHWLWLKPLQSIPTIILSACISTPCFAGQLLTGMKDSIAKEGPHL